MKKIRVLSLVIVCLFIFAACSSAKEEMAMSPGANDFGGKTEAAIDKDILYDAPTMEIIPEEPGASMDTSTGSSASSDSLLSDRKLIKNEVACGAVIFGLALVSAIALYLVNKFTSSVVASMILMAIIVGCMHGVNLMLIAIVPKSFAKYGIVSTMSGVLNAFTYIGAAAATSGFAALAEVSQGWTSTLFAWVIICLLGTVVCAVAVPLWKKFRAL